MTITLEKPQPGADTTAPAPAEPTIWGTRRTQAAEHLGRANTRTRSWLAGEDLTPEQLAADVTTHRGRETAKTEERLRARAMELTRQIHATQREVFEREANGDPRNVQRAKMAAQEATARQQGELDQVERQLRALHAGGVEDQLPPTIAEMKAARRRHQLRRATTLAGSVIGSVVMPFEDPRWLLASLPAAAVALWRVGLRPDDDSEPEQATAVAVEDHALPVQGPAFAAAVMAAQTAAETSMTPGSAAAAQVTAAAVQAAQFQGEADIVNAFSRAGIITAAEKEETHLVAAIRPDGPGWTATIELPGGKPAEEAIKKAKELASALRVKSTQLELSIDTSDDGHEGRVVMWVSNLRTPFTGEPTPSELIGADSWDFWAQGVPLGPTSRGVRKILDLLWSSLLIGGLMGYGKTYLARLIASAAVLDPYVNITLISGKPGADWAALKIVATQYVTGNSPSVIREIHAVMEDLIEDMAERGTKLETMFEQDPKSCPQGKITPQLAKQPGLGLTLLIVDELQEILDGASGIKLIPRDDTEFEEDGNRKDRGQNGKAVLVSLFARFNRVARYVGGIGLYVTQRPDASSVPTELRNVCAKCACYRVKGATSSRMVLGDDAVAAGAAPHLLTDTSLGVFVLDEGAADGHSTIWADVIDLDQFRDICERGRALRLKAGTLTGFAAARWEQERESAQRTRVLADAVAAMDAHGVDRARLVVLAAWMAELAPEFWHSLTEADLSARLRAAGAGTSVRIGAVDGVQKASGYTREQLVTALSNPV